MKTIHFCELCGFQSTDKREVKREERAHAKPKFKEDERVFYNGELPSRPWRRIMEVRYKQEELSPVYDLEVDRNDYPNRGRDVGEEFLRSRIFSVQEYLLTSAEEAFQNDLKRRKGKKRK